MNRVKEQEARSESNGLVSYKFLNFLNSLDLRKTSIAS